MRLTLLGTGNAAGMPLYGCDCSRCTLARADAALARTPCSGLLQVGNRQYLIDAGQLHLGERFPPGSLHGIFLTHFHPDHVQGLFHLRWGKAPRLPVFSPPDTEGCADLYKHPGMLNFRSLRKFEAFSLDDLRITPLPLIHSKPTFGYLFEHADSRIAYLTDTKGLPPKTEALLREVGLDLMVIDCSFAPGADKRGHNNLDEALAIHAAVKPQRTVLTHIGHDLDIWLSEHSHKLPPDVLAGHDRMLAFEEGACLTTRTC